MSLAFGNRTIYLDLSDLQDLSKLKKRGHIELTISLLLLQIVLLSGDETEDGRVELQGVYLVGQSAFPLLLSLGGLAAKNGNI